VRLVEPDSEINGDAHRYTEIEGVVADQCPCVAGSVCRVGNSTPYTKHEQRGSEEKIDQGALIILRPTSALISDPTPMKIKGTKTQSRNKPSLTCTGSGSIICSNRLDDGFKRFALLMIASTQCPIRMPRSRDAASARARCRRRRRATSTAPPMGSTRARFSPRGRCGGV
jgi:hypothetical protein